MRHQIGKLTTPILLAPGLLGIIVYPGLARSIEFPKLIFFQALVLLVVLGFALLLLRRGELRFFNRFENIPSKIIFMMWLIIFFATLASDQLLNSLFGSFERSLGLITWSFLFAYFYIFLAFVEKSKLEKSYLFLVWTGALIAIYGLLQKLGFDPLFANFNSDFLEGRIFSTLGNPDFLAQFLAPLIVLSTLKFIDSRELKYFLPILPMSFALILTESRASFLALLVSLFLYCLASIKNKKLILLPAGLIITLFLIVVQSGLLFQRFQLNPENFRSLESRFNIWESSLAMVTDHPLFGVGPDNFSIHFPAYTIPKFYHLEDNLHLVADRAHNELLDIAVIGGLPLLLLYICLALFILSYLFKKSSSRNAKFLAFSLLVIYLQNQLSFSQIAHYVLYFYLLGSFLIEISDEKMMIWRPSKSFRFMGGLIIICFIFITSKEVIVDRVYAETWYTNSFSTQDPKQSLINAISFDPYNSKYRYDLMMAFPEELPFQLADLRQIEGETIPILAWTANDLFTRDPEASFVLFEKVIEMNPSYPHSQRAYADALYLYGDYEKAALHYEEYLKVSPQFWTWCEDLESRSEYEQKKFRIFYKNVADFNNSLIHLHDSYIKIAADQKAADLSVKLDCLLTESQ